MDKSFFEIGGLVKALIYLYKQNKPFLRVEYRRGAGLSSTTAMKVHDFMYSHGLIEIYPEPHAFLFQLTENGKKIAQLLEVAQEIFDDKIDRLHVEKAIIVLKRVLEEL